MKNTVLRQLIVAVTGLITALLAVDVLANPGDLYVASRTDATVIRVFPGPFKTVFASGVNAGMKMPTSRPSERLSNRTPRCCRAHTRRVQGAAGQPLSRESRPLACGYT